MSDQSHTPGPWYQYDSHNHVADSRSQMVCTDTRPRRTWGEKGEFSGPFIVCQTGLYTCADRDEAAANAQLIAAAPDLLAACEQYMIYLMARAQCRDCNSYIENGDAVSITCSSHREQHKTTHRYIRDAIAAAREGK